MKQKIKDIVIYLVIFLIACLLWQGLELVFYGEIQHRKVDDIIGLILIISLYGNYKQRQFNNVLMKELVKSTVENLHNESENSQ